MFAGNRERFEKDYLEIAQKLKIRGFGNPGVDNLLLVKKALEAADFGNWILVIDNADDMNLFYGNTEEVEHENGNLGPEKGLSVYIPENCNGSIIYTTRSKVDALRLTNEGNIISVSTMDIEDSKALLRSKLANEVSDEAGWEILLEELDYLPLAIVQAASYIRQNSWTVPQYVKHFRDQDNRNSGATLKILMHDFRDKQRDKSVTNAVLKTWIISVEQLEAQYPLAVQVLWKMAFLDRQNIPRCLLTYSIQSSESKDDLEVRPETEDLDVIPQNRLGIRDLDSHELYNFDIAIGRLKAYSFISTTENSSSDKEEHYTIHRLVQLFARHWLRDHKKSADLILSGTLVRLFYMFPQEAKLQEWPLCADLLPHLLQLPDIEGSPVLRLGYYAGSLFEVAHYLREIGQYTGAKSSIRCAIAMITGDQRHYRFLLKCQFRLASILCHEGSLTEAEELQRQLVKETEDLYGPDDRYTLDRKSFLGHLLELQGRLKEAESLIRNSSERYGRLYPIEDDQALSIRRDLGRVLLKLDQLEEAEQTIREVLQISGGSQWSDDENIIPVLGDLAEILVKKRKFDEAEIIRRQIFERDERLLGREHPSTLISMSNLASSLVHLDRITEGEELFREVLRLREKVLGNQQEDTLSTMQVISICLRHQGRLQEASEFMRRAYSGYETEYGPTDYRTLECRADLEQLLEEIKVDGA